MGVTELLQALKAEIKKCLAGMLLEVNPSTGEREEAHNLPLEPYDEWGPPEPPEDDPECGTDIQTDRETEKEPKKRPPDVYLMNLPERSDWYSRIPYVIIRFLNVKDRYNKDEKDQQATVNVRVLIATYCSDGEDGGLQVLEIIERIRIHLESGMLLDENYMLQSPFDGEVYPDDTGNYFLGEINMTWSIPIIERSEFHIEDVRRKENE
ncbi:MAG: hypothetical protein IJ206_09165 [Oscillospiraceae bacterium]|nr:hypothetical protein [Oscillospiraceae bacterium]